jgi:energy-converting hydrogenase Eha subunit F
MHVAGIHPEPDKRLATATVAAVTEGPAQGQVGACRASKAGGIVDNLIYVQRTAEQLLMPSVRAFLLRAGCW